MMNDNVTWKNASTLEQAVVRMLEEKKGKTPEFQSLVAYFGRERIEKIWKDYRAEKEAQGKAE